MSDSIENKQTVIDSIAEFTGLWSRVFVHRFTGYQRLGLVSIFGGVGAMMLLNGIFNIHVAVPLLGEFGARIQSNSLRYFAIAFLLCALVQRRERKQAFRRGEKWHGQHGGVSHLEFLSGAIPREWIYRYIEPGLVFLLGYEVAGRFGFMALGICWMLSAVGFAVTEALHFQALEDRQWSFQNQGMDADRLAGRGAAATSASSFASGGLSTGLDDRLARDIAGRSGQAPVPEAAPSEKQAESGAGGTLKGRLALGAVALAVMLALLWPGETKTAPPKVNSPALIPPLLAVPALAPLVPGSMFAAKPAAPPSVVPTAAAPPANAQPSHADTAAFPELLGAWVGAGTWEGRGCNARVETQSGAEKTLTAFVTLGCYPGYVARAKRRTASEAAAWERCVHPLAAVMTGKASAPPKENAKPSDPSPRAVLLHPQKPIVLNGQACAVSAATLTPFGADRALFEFTDDSGNWQILLSRGQ